jgi:hypothetical protein
MFTKIRLSQHSAYAAERCTWAQFLIVKLTPRHCQNTRHTGLTFRSCVARRTVAPVGIHLICARSAVLTWRTGTFNDFCNRVITRTSYLVEISQRLRWVGCTFALLKQTTNKHNQKHIVTRRGTHTCLAFRSCVAIRTVTRIWIHTVCARSTVLTWRTGTFIDICNRRSQNRILPAFCLPGNWIGTIQITILAKHCHTSDTCLTLGSCVARRTVTRVWIHVICARPTVLTWRTDTFVHVCNQMITKTYFATILSASNYIH